MYNYGTARHANALSRQARISGTSSKKARHTNISLQHLFQTRKKNVQRVQMRSDTKERNKDNRISPYLKKIQVALISLLVVTLIGYLFLIKIVPQLVTFDQPTNVLLIRQENDQNHFYFIHFNPDQTLNYIASFNNNEEVSLPFLETTTSLNDSYSVINATQKTNQHLINSVYSHLLGLLIDEVIVVQTENKPDIKSTNLFAYVFDTKISLSLNDRFSILKYYIYTYKDPVTIENVSSISQVGNNLSDNQATWKNENTQSCPIAVVNTTPTKGLAQSYSKSIEKSGGFIIRVTSSATLKDKSSIYVTDNSTCLGIANDIKRLFPNEIVTEINPAITNEYRANVVLYLGEDSYKVTD